MLVTADLSLCRLAAHIHVLPHIQQCTPMCMQSEAGAGGVLMASAEEGALKKAAAFVGGE